MANYTAVAAGGAWNVTTTWSPAGIPGAADTAILNSSSGNVTVPAAGATCVTLTLTGYTGTLLLSGNLTIVTSGLNLGSFTGTINFNAGDIIMPDGLFNLGNASVYTTLGTGGVLITKPSASFSIYNTNNKIWNCKFALGAAGTTSPTIYFEDNPVEVTGLVSFQATTTGTYNIISGDIFTPNLIFLKISGNFTLSGSTIYTTSTSGQNLGITGSGNQTLTGSGTHQLRSPLRIAKTGGTLSLSGTINYNTGTLTYVSGTVNAGSSTLNIGASATLDTGGMSWNNVTMAGNKTLLSNLNVSGSLTTQTTAVVFSGAFTVNVEGNLAIDIVTSGASTPIVLNGTGSQSWTHGSAVYLTNNLTINKASGTLTLGTNIYYRTGTFTYITATSVNTSTNSTTLNIGGSCTLATNGISWINLNTSVTATITLTNDLVWSNNWTATTGTIAFSGVGGNLAPSTTANLLFTGNPTITLKNNIQVTNVTLNGSVVNTNTISLSGNLSVLGSCSGATSYIINGTGSQSWSSPAVVYLQSPLTINKPSGVLTLGAIVGMIANLTHIAGDVDAVTNSNTFYARGGAFNVEGMTFNNFTFATTGGDAITLASNLYTVGTFTVGGNGTINGAFNIFSGKLNINNSTSGASVIVVTYNGGSFYCSGDCTFSGGGGGGQVTTTNTAYVGGSMFFNATGNEQGPANLIMTGNGVVSQTLSSNRIYSNIFINTGGKIVFSNTLYFTINRNITISLQRGNVDATKCTLLLPVPSGTYNLINNHKINWKTVYLPSGGNISMNEFFSGSAQVKTNVLPTSTTNYTITFTDNFEKISKFVKLSNCTLSRRNQLLMLTNIPDKRTNIGVRFFNNLPNGVAENKPSISVQPMVSSALVGDPAMLPR